MTRSGPFTKAQLAVIQWAAEECKRQRSGELSVSWMLQAWNHAMRADRLGFITENDILHMAKFIEPEVNAKGWRTVDVRVGYDAKGPWEEVPRQMVLYLDALAGLGPEEAYRNFEEIHPLRDGNGRVGSLIFNWLRGSLADPIHPPDWDDPAAYWGDYEKQRNYINGLYFQRLQERHKDE